MINAILSLALLGLGLGVMLGFAAKYLKVEAGALVQEIEDMLPGSQCGQCGFPGCSPAAEAVAGAKPHHHVPTRWAGLSPSPRGSDGCQCGLKRHGRSSATSGVRQ